MERRQLVVSLAVMGVVLMAVGFFGIFSSNFGFLTRGSVNDAAAAHSLVEPAVHVSLLSEGGTLAPPAPFFTDPANASNRTPVQAFQLNADAATDLLDKQSVSLTIGGKTYPFLTPLRKDVQYNGNIVVSGVLGRDNGSDFVAVFNENHELLYLQTTDPFDTTTTGVSTLIRQQGTDLLYGQNTKISEFDAENDEHEYPPSITPETLLPPLVALPTTGPAPVTVRDLVLVTPNAITSLGDFAAAEAYIQGEVARANLILQLSGVQNENGYYRHELVGVINTNTFGYNEQGDHLSYITNSPAVAALRNQYGADLVSMFSSEASYCGVAWLTYPWLGGQEAYGFSDVIVSPECQGIAAFAHETGHNMGFHHDRLNGGGNPAFTYSYGYRTRDDDPTFEPAFRTVMAYSCLNQGLANCPRIDRYSNPDPAYDYQGHHTGIDHDQENSADNSFTGILTMPYVANFRDPVAGNPPETPTNVSASDGIFADHIRIAWNISSGSLQYRVYRSESPTLQNAVLVATSASNFADDGAYDSTPLQYGHTYYYGIKGENPFGLSDYSPIDGGTISGELSGATISNLSASDGTSATSITLSWKNSAAPTNRLYRATAPRYCDPADRTKEITGLAPHATVYVTDTTSNGLTSETIYYYSASAVQPDGSEICYGKLDGGFAGILSPPTGLTASDGTFTDHVHLHWNPSGIADYYSIYVGTTPTLQDAHLLADHLTASDFDDTVAAFTAGQTNYYAVTATNLYVGETGFSNIDAGYVLGSDGIITGLHASDGTQPDRVVLDWDAEPGDPFYNVYRNTTNDSAHAALLGGTTLTTFNDIWAGVHTTYYYWIKTTGPYSTPDTGYTNSTTSPCVAGDFDLGGGNCQAQLRAINQNGSVEIQSFTGSTWTSVVGMTSGTVLSPVFRGIQTTFDGTNYKTSRAFLNYSLSPYAGKTITSAYAQFFNTGAGQHQLHTGDTILLVPATPANPTALSGSDFSQLNTTTPTILGSVDFDLVESQGVHQIPFTPTGLSALQTAANTGSGSFSTALLFDQTFQPFNPSGPVNNQLSLVSTDPQLPLSYNVEYQLVVNYHA